MEFRSLELATNDELLEVFNLAFSDYVVPLQLSMDQLRSKFHNDNVVLAYSVGAFNENKLVGFVLHGIDTLENIKYAYNAGTGVVPAFRGHNLTQKMYKHLLPKLKTFGVEKIVLEVIQQNITAHSIYERIGFKTIRSVNCYKKSKYYEKYASDFVILERYNILDSFHISTHYHEHSKLLAKATWQNSKASISRQKNDLIQYLAHEENNVIGSLLLNKKEGKVMEIFVEPAFRRQKVATNLIYAASQVKTTLKVINIDASAEDLKHFFHTAGFELFVNQYEMEFEINN
jgi:ribosomal protein S18 acetylase RimI-like enzyme